MGCRGLWDCRVVDGMSWVVSQSIYSLLACLFLLYRFPVIALVRTAGWMYSGNIEYITLDGFCLFGFLFYFSFLFLLFVSLFRIIIIRQNKEVKRESES